MILVDTSVWIDHLHREEKRLGELLDVDLVVTHPGVIEELAMGRLSERRSVISMLAALRSVPQLSHPELLRLIEARQLWGRGLSVIDASMLGGAMVAGAKIWSRDKRLVSAAQEFGLILDETT